LAAIGAESFCETGGFGEEVFEWLQGSLFCCVNPNYDHLE
jgi:hypothetical protein